MLFLCAQTLPSLLFVGVSGIVAPVALVLTVGVWFLLYMSSGMRLSKQVYSFSDLRSCRANTCKGVVNEAEPCGASHVEQTVLYYWFNGLSCMNIIMNACTMLGGVGGFIQLFRLMFHCAVPICVGSYLPIVFFLAGAVASYNLTRPMILQFQKNLRSVQWNWRNLTSSNDSRKWVVLMAFCTACSSAIFAVYNTPIIAMLPAAWHGLWVPFLIKTLVFSVVIIASFSLYYVSVSEKNRRFSGVIDTCQRIL